MWEEVLGFAVNYGLWASLFVGLLVYVLKDSNKREKKYQDTIKKLVSSLQVVTTIQETTEQLRKDIQEIKQRVKK
ncbi:MAG: BhlA/UviB family holin-like peptide [Firmicutes bacterium]|nr:BhlA/UviB family holin-like peptide [Bacillota bacterium]